jgi:uncharacterized membrane protein YhaH (DUF805 family)
MAFQPLRDMFVFSGRSRRSEVLAFGLLGIFANLMTLEGSGVVIGAIHAVWSFLWGFPWIALFVRRLHDQGRSARWAWAYAAVFAALMASTPLLAQSPTSIYRVTVLFLGVFHPTGPFAIIHGIALAAVWLGLLILLFWEPTPDENQYGPDPRLDPADAGLATE